MSIMILLILLFVPVNLVFAKTYYLQRNDVVVVFEESLLKISQEVMNAYPPVKDELSESIGWEVDFRPTVILLKGKDQFRRLIESELIIAFAVPSKNRIVIDTSRVYTKPFTLEATLKHELCHLLLHQNIRSEPIPRWLDEGVCQWASGGISELMTENAGRALEKAVVSQKLIRIEELNRFPRDTRLLILAYEESKSIVEYITNEFGEKGLLQVLEYLKEGYSIHDALQESLHITIPELERRWHSHLKRKYTWLSYLGHNIYTILFSLAALITLYGFVRLIKKKRAYRDMEDEEETDQQKYNSKGEN